MVKQTEAERIAVLRRLNLLDTRPSECFDRITRMAGRIFGVPIAAVSLTDTDRQWFKSRVGLEHWTIPRDKAPCSEVAETSQVVVIEDFLADPFYRDSHLARSGMRFYAGAPLVTGEGYCLGAMCVLGPEPRTAVEEEIAVLHDLAAMAMAQIELRHALGRIDPISGLPNRAQFLDDAADLVQGHRQTAVLLDLIGNEQREHALRVMGHAAVDDVVKAAACALDLHLGSPKVYHVATTQVVTLVPETEDNGSFVRRLRAVADRVRQIGGLGMIGTSVVGMAPFTPGATRPADVLRNAQSAAQDARLRGRFVQVHSAQSDAAFARSYALLQGFATALESKSEFRLLYQPRVDIATGRCVGAEALLRWTHPNLGPISPGEFIPLIERTTLASTLTEWVLETAVAQASAWIQSGRDLVVSVNISSANLNDLDFADNVKSILVRHQVPPMMLELEITETAVMSDAPAAMTQLLDLANAGIRLAIDDFGTGYSSLSYLQRLPVNVVKIDRSFLRDLNTDTRRLSLVKMMIAMTKHLGHRVVAEGVETAEVLELLRSTECDEAQGYIYAAPLSPDEFDGWLPRQECMPPTATPPRSPLFALSHSLSN